MLISNASVYTSARLRNWPGAQRLQGALRPPGSACYNYINLFINAFFNEKDQRELILQVR